jgi:hypothetical protein
MGMKLAARGVGGGGVWVGCRRPTPYVPRAENLVPWQEKTQREEGVVEKKQWWTRAKGYKGINIS